MRSPSTAGSRSASTDLPAATGSFLEIELTATDSRGLSTVIHQDLRPELVAVRFIIRRVIARGGMGEVYEAEDQELRSRVALKTVLAVASSPSAT